MSGKSPTKLEVTSRHDHSCLLGRKASNPNKQVFFSYLQVKNFTFYDVVLDFILMDAFDDLENPPSSVIAVVNNRWLSNGFKETVSILEILDLSPS